MYIKIRFLIVLHDLLNIATMPGSLRRKNPYSLPSIFLYDVCGVFHYVISRFFAIVPPLHSRRPVNVCSLSQCGSIFSAGNTHPAEQLLEKCVATRFSSEGHRLQDKLGQIVAGAHSLRNNTDFKSIAGCLVPQQGKLTTAGGVARNFLQPTEIFT